ncbi:DUF2975 domain-containing protein [Psychroserpens sp. Hel_I_66]|uniref:DUF2975 domain-containing protein n=1 Tax=Psychroserpens sp. Hel_I_66 TaxID=1250004 RepID=UPI0018CFAA04|nr:DUF2975 domain-containing protein [Psychroserpens sp. Hel_I_66]
MVISIVGNIILSTIGLFFDSNVLYPSYSKREFSFNIKLIFIFKSVALLIFVFGVFILISKLTYLLKRDFFNSILINSFSKSGKLFLISGSFGFLTSIISMLNILFLKDYSSQLYLNIDSKGLYIMLMILGLFFLLFSKVLAKANEIQQENELTI